MSTESQSLSQSEENSVYKYIFKIILIGDSGTGKTSLINRYINNKFDSKYQCTIGVDFLMKKITLEDQTPIKLQIWDTAGMEKYKQITSTYYRGAQGAIVVFDLTSQSSFDSVGKWVDDFCAISNPKYHQTIYIVGNKSDLQKERVVSQEDIDTYCSLNNFKYIEASARTGHGVQKLFINFTTDLVDGCKKETIVYNPLGSSGNAINLDTKTKDENTEVKKTQCC